MAVRDQMGFLSPLTVLPVSVDTLLPPEPQSTAEETIYILKYSDKHLIFFSAWRSYLCQSRIRSQARCATSLVAGILCCPVRTLLPPSHLVEASVASTGVSCSPARQPLGRMRWEERRRVGELPGVTEWVGKFETLGCKKAVAGQQPLWLPDESSCWPAWPGDAAPGTCWVQSTTSLPKMSLCFDISPLFSLHLYFCLFSNQVRQ